jgi:hypothetical protein
MKNSRKVLYAVGALFTLLIFSCVTVNIYFPAEKVESVAGEIVDDIRNRKGADKGSSLKNLLLRKTLFALISSNAWADEVTTVSNPTIRALKEKMKARYAQMKPFYQKGMLVEGGNGYVSMGNTEGLGLKEKRDLITLVDSENNDRTTLYKEVAKALKIDPSQVDRIAKIFAGEWQK